jgi:hypothetical protein
MALTIALATLLKTPRIVLFCGAQAKWLAVLS